MHNFEANPIKKLLSALIKQSKADMDKRFAKAKISITPLQFGVLVMAKPRVITLNEIATEFKIKAPSLVPAVDALEKAGLLHRQSDTKDRRKTLLVITKKGLDLLKKIPFDDKNDALNTAFNKLTPAKQKQLLSLLEELTNNFSK